MVVYEQARAGAEEAAKQRRQNETRLGKVLQGPPSANTRSTKPLTMPVDLQLSTAKRRRLHEMAAEPMVGCLSSFQWMAFPLASCILG